MFHSWFKYVLKNSHDVIFCLQEIKKVRQIHYFTIKQKTIQRINDDGLGILSLSVTKDCIIQCYYKSKVPDKGELMVLNNLEETFLFVSRTLNVNIFS